MRSPATPGNVVADGEESLADRFRALSGQLARAWAVSCGNQTLEHLRRNVPFLEEVRVYMGKFDADERRPLASRCPRMSSGC